MLCKIRAVQEAGWFQGAPPLIQDFIPPRDNFLELSVLAAWGAAGQCWERVWPWLGSKSCPAEAAALRTATNHQLHT